MALTLIRQFESLYELKSFHARTDSLHRVQSHLASFNELLWIITVVLGLLIVLVVLESGGVQQTEQVLQLVQTLIGVVQIDYVVPIVHVGQLIDRRQVVRLNEYCILRMATKRFGEHRWRIAFTEAGLDGGQLVLE